MFLMEKSLCLFVVAFSVYLFVLVCVVFSLYLHCILFKKKISLHWFYLVVWFCTLLHYVFI